MLLTLLLYIVQRLFDKNYRYKFDPSANPTFIKHRPNQQRTSWAIDDDDDESVSVAPPPEHQQPSYNSVSVSKQ